MEQPKKKSKFKIGCLGIIIIVIIIIIICCIAGSAFNKPTVVTPTSTNSSKSTSSSTPTNFKLGETIKIGNYDFNISDLKNTQNIDDNYGNAMSTTKNNFAIFKITIKNNSNSPISSLSTGYQKIFALKVDNSTYYINNNATISAFTVHNESNSYDTAFCGGNTLSPHTPYNGYLVFETPKAVTNATLTININNETANIKF